MYLVEIKDKNCFIDSICKFTKSLYLTLFLFLLPSCEEFRHFEGLVNSLKEGKIEADPKYFSSEMNKLFSSEGFRSTGEKKIRIMQICLENASSPEEYLMILWLEVAKLFIEFFENLPQEDKKVFEKSLEIIRSSLKESLRSKEDCEVSCILFSLENLKTMQKTAN